MNYPRQVKRELNFDCIGEAWRIFRENPAQFILNGLMIMLSTAIPATLVVIAMLPFFINMGNPDNMAEMLDNIGLQLAFQGIIYLVILVGYLVAGPFMAGATKMTLMTLRGQRAEARDSGRFLRVEERPNAFCGNRLLELPRGDDREYVLLCPGIHLGRPNNVLNVVRNR